MKSIVIPNGDLLPGAKAIVGGVPVEIIFQDNFNTVPEYLHEITIESGKISDSKIVKNVK